MTRSRARLCAAALAAALAVAAAPAAARAELAPDTSGVHDWTRPTTWLTAGLGVGSCGLGMNASLCHHWGMHVLAARVAGTTNIPTDIFGEENQLWSAGLLYGAGLFRPAYALWVGAGLGVSGGKHQPEVRFFEPDRTRHVDTGLSFPLELQAIAGIGKGRNLGISLWADLNSRESFGGVSLIGALAH
ncbi:MAG TPA: hypothetical protein VMS93_00230 [Candidatus Saccharimonadales bacterium]|nr:hypothetical protein [Candidatus Saccharimonadales bacterium]